MELEPLAAENRAARRRALRALLAGPLRTAGADDEVLRLIRRHAAELREWLASETGWRLVVDADSARLFKTVATTSEATYPARDGKGRAPFGRRRYVLLCLALSVLEAADAQITLGRLAEGVLVAASDPELTAAGITFTLGRREERSDLVAVVRLLLSLGVLERVAGDEDAYLSDSGDALYDVHRRVLASMLTGTRGPSTIDAAAFEARLAELTAEPVPDTDDLRNRALRQRLTRRLLDEPVVYYDELADDERAYLVGQRHAITRRIEDATGLVTEMRAEGIAMVDPEDELTDVRMPEQRTDGHVTLLVAEYLAERASAGQPVPLGRLRAYVRQQAAEHSSYWRRGVSEPGADAELLATALDKLRALRLVADAPGELDEPSAVLARPAIARFALDAPTISDRQTHRLPGGAGRPATAPKNKGDRR
ncbi:TIGR02678 family protein [Pseudofrankia sp. BMG5.36]|uniref:TIGR02678 family protein n=1 Tax=Pseudofrankia sp. BMG5.36 TaxID=1834512 RepID=UPI0008D8E669|nr:TIGR02678 family protein [Pseudofrankia sp. BMG5.36]OHV43680.1 TIGR02678 family protein [Pseudofrankia sp. BMG5.36]